MVSHKKRSKSGKASKNDKPPKIESLSEVQADPKDNGIPKSDDVPKASGVQIGNSVPTTSKLIDDPKVTDIYEPLPTDKATKSNQSVRDANVDQKNITTHMAKGDEMLQNGKTASTDNSLQGRKDVGNDKVMNSDQTPSHRKSSHTDKSSSIDQINTIHQTSVGNTNPHDKMPANDKKAQNGMPPPTATTTMNDKSINGKLSHLKGEVTRNYRIIDVDDRPQDNKIRQTDRAPPVNDLSKNTEVPKEVQVIPNKGIINNDVAAQDEKTLDSDQVPHKDSIPQAEKASPSSDAVESNKAVQNDIAPLAEIALQPEKGTGSSKLVNGDLATNEGKSVDVDRVVDEDKPTNDSKEAASDHKIANYFEEPAGDNLAIVNSIDSALTNSNEPGADQVDITPNGNKPHIGETTTESDTAAQREQSTDNEHNVAAAFKTLIDAVKILSSQDNCNLVLNHFDQIKRLQTELAEKEEAFAAHANLTTDLAKQKLALQQIVDERDETIAEHVKTRNGMQEQVQTLEGDSTSRKAEIEKARLKATEQDDILNAKSGQIETLEEKLKEAYEQAKQLQENVESLKMTNDSLARKHDTAVSRLEDFDNITIALHVEDPTTVASRMKSLWETAKDFVVLYFKEDIEEHSLQNDSVWENLLDPDYFSHHVPLPPTNSTNAKQMRISVILAIIARALDFHIFCPTYAFAEESGVREELCRLAVSDSRRESFCRGLFLSFFLDKQEIATNERIDNAVEYIMRHVRGLLSRSKAEEFEAGARQVAREAQATWAAIRSIKERYEPSFETTQIEGFKWDTLLFDSDISGSIDEKTAIQGGRDDEILIILPRLYVIENNQEPRLIADGTVLRRSQSLAAAQELEGLQLVPQSSPTFGRNAASRLKSRRIRMSGTWNGDRSSEN